MNLTVFVVLVIVTTANSGLLYNIYGGKIERIFHAVDANHDDILTLDEVIAYGQNLLDDLPEDVEDILKNTWTYQNAPVENNALDFQKTDAFVKTHMWELAKEAKQNRDLAWKVYYSVP